MTCQSVGQGPAGLTLLELIIALAVVSVLMGTAVFGFHQWQTALQSKSLARQVASMLRESRAQAVATLREVRVKFLAEGEVGGGRPVCLRQLGNLSHASTQWQDLPSDKLEFPRLQLMGFTTACQISPAAKYLSFNPDGSSNALYVCIQERAEGQPPEKKYAVGVSHAGTGRVVVLRWNSASLCFE